MRAKISKVTKKTFKMVMKKAMPEFNPIAIDGLPMGCQVYERKIFDSISLYVMLIISPKYDQFTLELAWSEQCRFPVSWGGLTLPDDPPRDGEMRFRMQRLWGEQVGEDIWWSIGNKLSDNAWMDLDALLQMDPPVDETIKRVRPQVIDAVAKIRSHAFPYFKRICSERDIDFLDGSESDI